MPHSCWTHDASFEIFPECVLPCILCAQPPCTEPHVVPPKPQPPTTKGIYAKASEVGSELIFKLEPDNSGDPCTNPASIADNSGAIAIDAGAFLIDTIDSCAIIVISAVILSQGNAPRMALPVWISASTMLTGLLAYAFVRCSNSAVKTVRERYNQMMWGLRLAMYAGGIATFVVHCIVVGILFR